MLGVIVNVSGGLVWISGVDGCVAGCVAGVDSCVVFALTRLLIVGPSSVNEIS